eukprot:8585173-Lingulodinium_polyedra.AAC.1
MHSGSRVEIFIRKEPRVPPSVCKAGSPGRANLRSTTNYARNSYGARWPRSWRASWHCGKGTSSAQ